MDPARGRDNTAPNITLLTKLPHIDHDFSTKMCTAAITLSLLELADFDYEEPSNLNATARPQSR